MCIRDRCGSVRFSETRNPTARFGTVFRYRKSYGAVRCCDISNGAVRRGSPLNCFFYGAAPLSVGKTVQHRFSSTVHRMNKLYKTAVGFARLSRFFSGHERNRCFSTVCFSTVTALINRTNPWVHTVFCRFFSSRQSHQQQQVLGALKNIFNKSIRTYISSVKNKSKFRKVHDACRDTIISGMRFFLR